MLGLVQKISLVLFCDKNSRRAQPRPKQDLRNADLYPPTAANEETAASGDGAENQSADVKAIATAVTGTPGAPGESGAATVGAAAAITPLIADPTSAVDARALSNGDWQNFAMPLRILVSILIPT